MPIRVHSWFHFPFLVYQKIRHARKAMSEIDTDLAGMIREALAAEWQGGAEDG